MKTVKTGVCEEMVRIWKTKKRQQRRERQDGGRGKEGWEKEALSEVLVRLKPTAAKTEGRKAKGREDLRRIL